MPTKGTPKRGIRIAFIIRDRLREYVVEDNQEEQQ